MSTAPRVEHRALLLGWLGGAAVAVAAAKLVVARHHRQRDRTGPAPDLAAEDARLRDDERCILARELHDVVTHQLSTVSLQVMGHLDSDDAVDLAQVLRRVHGATSSALIELRLLVRVLREHPGPGSGPDGLAELSRRRTPTEAAAAWSTRLSDAGFDPVVAVPARADQLEMTVQATLVRTLDVACDNILRHTPSGSACRVALAVHPTQVVITVASPLPVRPHELVALGRGLRGLRERVDLIGGGLRAGPASAAGSAPQWVVVVTLPRD